jgi:hypothetical protein
MTRKFLFVFALIAFTFLTPALAQAQEKAPAASAEKPAKVDLRNKADGPPPGPLKDWIDAENALIDRLSDKDKESFLLMRMKYAYISAVRVAERDIGNAVKSCGEKNPGIKGKMEARFKQWQGAVNPILDTADKGLERELKNQKIVDVKQAKHVFKLHKDAYEDGEKKVTKTPITTEEACEGLLESMDDTEDNMISLLQDTLLPESVIRKRADASAKAEAEAKKVDAATTPPPGSQSASKTFGKKAD